MRPRLSLVVAGGLLLTGLSVAPAAAAPPAPTLYQPPAETCVTSGFDVAGEATRGARVSVYSADGTLLGSTVAGHTWDEGGAWDLGVPANPGVNTIYAVASDDTGDSPPSRSVSFTGVAKPYLEDFASNLVAISPRNRDGVADRVVMSVRVKLPGGLEFYADKDGTDIANSAWTTVTEHGRTFSWTWDGKDASGAFVPSGTYRLTAFWHPDEFVYPYCPDAVAGRDVVVDNDAPRFRSVIAPDHRTFYPRRDDAFGAFRDTVTVRGERVNELTGARVQVFRHGATAPLFTRLIGTHYADTDIAWSWNGRHTDGSLYREGAYDVRFRLRDFPGNARWTPRTTVYLSHQHVVAHTVTSLRRAAYYSSTELDPACDFGVSRTTSEYVHGLRTVAHKPGCIYDPDVPHLSRVNWQLPLPRATVYHSFQPFVFGEARNRPTRNGLLLATLDRRTGTSRELGATGTAERRHLVDTVYGPAFVTPARTFLLTSLYMGSYNLDFDAREVGVIVRYGTLAY